ncbi:TetR/AcrR family transcriptional regulator [Pseudochelatococcus sp. B33]
MSDRKTKPTRARQNGGSRDKILSAALQEFAMKGIDGARVDEIALASGVNKNMIYHYFGSKENLFVEVLESVYETVRSRQDDLSLKELDPVSAMRALIEHTADIWIEVPELNRLLASENLHKAAHVKKSTKIQNMYHPLVASLSDILGRGEREGVFRSGIDPIDLYISITSLSAYYVAHRYTFEAIFKRKLMTKARTNAKKKTICDMILRYLRP